ncbi:hypothetical protein RHGRI_014419 [Rhododendron griersonianum]|uniref:GATA-type domain-containing protein n=1 Tax=Rhododendron griersonianum TaxID=479676 RepID=A0AAV6K9H5_9ERIC|nr:hypothetical protein RHGRI_014419 [Rhododendron griersonianum]
MNEIKKFCCDCKTTETPLWRAGPSGPKSLCNACGIRYRKKRSAVVGLNKRVEKEEEKSATTSLANTNAAAAASSIAAAKNRCGGGGSKGGNLSEDLRVRLVALGKEVVMLQRQRSPMRKRQRRRRRRSVKRKLGEEEEQAAVLLMSLSCGFVFASKDKRRKGVKQDP